MFQNDTERTDAWVLGFKVTMHGCCIYMYYITCCMTKVTSESLTYIIR